jgi:hypothetical protein
MVRLPEVDKVSQEGRPVGVQLNGYVPPVAWNCMFKEDLPSGKVPRGVAELDVPPPVGYIVSGATTAR